MFQQMKYFIAVVQAHNFTRAAENCHISQSAISQQIKELESKVGTPLIKREGRSFSLTPAGQYFYRHAQSIIASVDQLLAETRQMAKRSREQYHLRLGYLASFGTQEFLQAVAQFSQKFPDVDVKIKSGNHEELFKRLRDDQIDLNFSDQRRALSQEYQNLFLTQADFMVMLPSAVATGKSRVTTGELEDLPCILVVKEPEFAEDQDYCRQVLGVKSSFTRASAVDEAQAMVAAGQGFIIINNRTQNLVDQQVGRVLPLFNGDHQLHQQYYAYWKRDNSGYYIEAFAKLLQVQFKS